eukprot:TRINITY_DN72034_c0_g1_i1.p1 TRINITY_DN72034_c0_g1~~TRINITY_DN72034_c0_g1_i1.p1  ORF type:complete len:237 (+),score=6.14 TRINITY_DN72034_c0_g1_i1:66-713(+)
MEAGDASDSSSEYDERVTHSTVSGEHLQSTAVPVANAPTLVTGTPVIDRSRIIHAVPGIPIRTITEDDNEDDERLVVGMVGGGGDDPSMMRRHYEEPLVPGGVTRASRAAMLDNLPLDEIDLDMLVSGPPMHRHRIPPEYLLADPVISEEDEKEVGYTVCICCGGCFLTPVLWLLNVVYWNSNHPTARLLARTSVISSLILIVLLILQWARRMSY